MPERFWLTDMESPIWKPLDLRAATAEEPLDVIVRRPPGTSGESLDAQLRAATDSYAATLSSDRRQIRHRFRGIEGTPIGQQVALVLPYLLGVCVLLTLLMACANAAILMIAQWTTREHEIAIRASIGAGRGRIIRSLLTESIIVAGCAGALGAGFTFALRGWIVARGIGDAPFYDLSINVGMLAQVAALTLFTGLLAGLMPAIYETRRLQTNPLRAMAGADRVRQRWRNALVVLEVAVTIALLVVTSSMVDGYRRARSADLGFEPRPLIGATVQHRDGVNIDTMMARLDQLPGVASAAASTALPYGPIGTTVKAASDARGSNGLSARQSAIDQAFFSTLGVKVRAGRMFTGQDTASTRSAIVNDTLARRLFGSGGAVGRALWIGDTSYDIIGVITDYGTNVSGAQQAHPQVFLPLARDGEAPTSMSFLIRAEGDPAPLLQSLRREMLDTAAGIEVRRLYSVAQLRRIVGEEVLVGTAPLIPAHHDRLAADCGRHLWGARLCGHATGARTGGAAGDRRNRSRRDSVDHEADVAARRHRRAHWRRHHVRLVAHCAGRRRRRQPLRSAAVRFRRAGAHPHRHWHCGVVDSLPPRVEDQPGDRAAHDVTAGLKASMPNGELERRPTFRSAVSSSSSDRSARARAR